MAITPNKNLELVSSKEQVKSKKDQMLENLKLEMLKDLTLDDKLIKRSFVMDRISEARKDKEFPTLIHFWGNTIKINEKKKYPLRIEKYKNAAGNEEALKQLDKELAEEIVLDYGNMIEFSSTETFEGKTAEQEAKNSFERLNKNAKYEKKIELIKKTDWEITHFVIKRTEAQIKELERAERAYEALHGAEATEPVVEQEPSQTVAQWPQQGVPTLQKAPITQETMKNELINLWTQLKNMRIGETTDLTMPDGKIIRLQKKDQYGWICLFNQVPGFDEYIDKDHYVVQNGNKSYISYVSNEALWKFLWIPEGQKMLPPHKEQLLLPPHIGDEEPIEDEKEIGAVVEHTATISDTTQITRAIAEREAGEKLRKIYKNTARYKPRSWPTKAGLFLGRWYIKDHYTRKYMKMKWGMQRDPNLVKWADRHAMELENKFNENIDKVGVIDEANYPETYKEIQILKDKLIQGAIDEGHFKDDFKSIIEDKTLDASNPVSKIIEANDIQQMSSNVVEDVLAFRDHQKLVKEITRYMFQHPALTANDPVEERNFDIFSRNKIVEYFKTYQKNPAFLKTLNIRLDDADAMKKLSNYQAHQGSLTMIAKQTMMLKVQILTKGEEAYDVKQEVKWWRGAMTTAGNRLDKPISDTSRFGKWLEKHPFAKNAFWTLRGITKLGAMITPALLLAPLGPLAAPIWAGSMALIATYIKKHAHYNKEHIGYQRNQANNLMENRKEREKLMNEINKMNPATRFMLYHFGLGKKARDVRQFRDYVTTTHDQLENSKTLADKMDKLLKKPQLTNTEPRQLEDLIGQALARLNFHKKTGQNFLGSENKDEAEKEYQTIYRLVLTGAMRLDKKLDEFETTRTYKREMDLINNGTGDKPNEIGYQKSRKRFKYRQTEKSLLGAAKAWGLAFGLSYLATHLASTDASSHTVSDKGNVGDNFMLGKHELASDNNVYTQSKDFFANPNAWHQTINFQYGGGTDATQVVSWHLTQSEYLTKVADIQNEIMQMTNISTATKTNIINQIHNKPREQVRAEKGFTNDYLQGMRCVEGLEQTAKALNDSWVNAATITLNPAYNGSVYDIVGQTYNNAGERVVQGALEYSQTIVTPENIIPIPIPGYMNTFKRADGDEDENRKNNNDYGQWRTTRSPAPKVNKQSDTNQSGRRRSGNTEETRFTNANN